LFNTDTQTHDGKRKEILCQSYLRRKRDRGVREGGRKRGRRREKVGEREIKERGNGRKRRERRVKG